MQRLIFRNPDGEEIDFTSGDFGVTKWKGFSKVDMDVQSQQVPFHDGSVFLDALLGERELSVTVAVNDDNNLEKRYRLKREMIHCLNPKLGEGELIYTNDYTSKKIVCVPDIPEFGDKNMNDSGTMKAMCSFTASDPYWEDVEATVVSFNADDYVEVENHGDVPCNIQGEIFPSPMNNLVLNNFTTNKKIEINGSFKAISIDTNIGKKSVVETIDKFSNVSNNYSVNNIVFGKNVFIMLGDSDTFYSLSGLDYFPINVEENINRLYSACYSDDLGYFIGLSKSMYTSSIYKSVDGINWKFVTNLNTLYGLHSVLFWSNVLSKFILGDNNGSYHKILVSSDGESWEQKTTLANNIRMFAESESFVCGVCDNSYSVITADGETWSEQASDFATDNIVWLDKFSKFFAYTDNSLKTSTDGITWTEIYSGTNIYSLTYDNILERIVIVADAHVKESYDCLTWNNVFSRAYYSISKLTYLPKLNAFISDDYLYTNNFNQRTVMAENLRPTDMVCSDDKKILCAINALDKSAIYNESKKWTTNSIGWSVDSYSRLAYGKGYFWLWASSKILKSSDGLNWSEVADNPGGTANKFYYVKELDAFIVIGNNGLLKISFDDCLTWTDKSNVTNNNLNDITSMYIEIFDQTSIYIAGDNSTVLLSYNGISWFSVTNEVLEALGNFNATGITWCNSLNTLVISIGSAIVNYRPLDNFWESVDYARSILLYGFSPKVKWSDELKCLLIANSDLNSINKCILTFDLNNFYGLEFPTNGYINDIEYVDFLNSFFVLQSSRNIVSMSQNNQNIINSISEDSDMNLNLIIGKNLLKITRDSGYVNMVLTYKQKYLGV